MGILEAAMAGPYPILLLLGVAGGFLLACLQGRGQAAPGAAWVVVLAVTATAGLVGSRLLHFDPGAGPGAKTILGALLLGSVVLFAALRFLGADARPADRLAVAIPLGFAVGRVGCLLAGCCFGHPADVPWAVVYDSQAAAFRAQVAAGLIGADAATSLPVHPTQLYEAMCALTVAAAVPWLRRRVAQPGSTLLAMLALLGGGRLMVEVFRARELATFAGVQRVQWLLLVIVLFLVLLLVQRERAPLRPRSTEWTGITPLRVMLLAAVPVAVLAAGAAWFAPVEQLLLLSFTVLALGAGCAALLHGGTAADAQRAVPGHVAASPAVLSAGVLLLALQSSVVGPADSVRGGPVHDAMVSASGARPSAHRYGWTFGISAAHAERAENRYMGTAYGDCGDCDLREDFDVRYQLVGVSAGHTAPVGKVARTIRFLGFAGSERTHSRSVVAPTAPATTTLSGVGLTIAGDGTIVGFMAGGALGRFSSARDDPAMMAIVSGRLGSRENLHLFGGVNDIEPLGGREPTAQAGIAYGFGPGPTIRGGVRETGAPFAGVSVPIGGFELHAAAMFGDDRDLRIGFGRRPPPQAPVQAGTR